MKRLIALCILCSGIVLLLSPRNAAAATQISYKVPLAYIGSDGNVYVTEVGAGLGTRLTQDAVVPDPTEQFNLCDICAAHIDSFRRYGNIHWSPDGTRFTFVEVYSGQVYIAESGRPVRLLNSDVRAGVGHGADMMAWSPDGTQLAVAANGITILSVANGSATSKPIEFEGVFIADGPGFEDWIGEEAYSNELSGESGYHSPLRLYWTRYGWLYQTSSIVMMDFEGNKLWSHEEQQDDSSLPDGQLVSSHLYYSKMFLMPDGKTAYVTEWHDQEDKYYSIPSQIDLASGVITPLKTLSANPNLGGGAVMPDGKTLVYLRYKSGGVIKGEPKSAIGKALFGDRWPYDGPSDAVSLWRQPLSGGLPISLFTKGGNGIAVIAPAPDSSGVAFSLVTASSELVRKLNAERPKAEVLAAFPHAELYYVNLLSGKPQFIARGGQPAFGKMPFVVNPVE